MTIAADLSEHAYRQAAMFLSSLDDDWARHIAATGPCRHAAKPAREPYEALVRAIAYQQLHAKAGDAILGRLLALYPGVDFPSPGQLLDTDETALRGCGFSATKLATIRGIAQASLDGVVPTRGKALGPFAWTKPHVTRGAHAREGARHAGRGPDRAARHPARRRAVDGGDAADLHAGALRHPARRRLRRARRLSAAQAS
ncbi:hypothetical protein HF906_04565 [Ralstonia solanacearum]|nr:hypothetical protein HF906_04565 [Ralstonia solanacearum]